MRLSAELKNRLIKWDSEIQNKKKKVFFRDLDYFGKGNVFNWQTGPVEVTMTQTQLGPANLETTNIPLPTPRENNVYVYDYSEYDDIGAPQNNSQYQVVQNKRGINNRERGRRGGYHKSSHKSSYRNYEQNTTSGNNEPYNGPNHYQSNYYQVPEHNGAYANIGNSSNHYQSNYQQDSEHNDVYPSRGRFPQQYGNQLSTHNRFSLLQQQGPKRGRRGGRRIQKSKPQ